VNRTAHSANTRAARAGHAAAFAGTLPVRGSAAPRSGGRQGAPTPGARGPRALVLPALALLLVTVAFGAAGTPAFAAGKAPDIQLSTKEIHATRIEAEMNITLNGPAVPWTIEYSEKEGGPWIPALSGTAEEGQPSAVVGGIIGQLKPATKYYLHATASNASGSSKPQTRAVTTLPLGVPAIPFEYLPNEADSFNIFELGTTFAKFKAAIEAEGSDTQYSFESATSENGPYVPVAGASGSITAAEESAVVGGQLEGLMPESSYFLRVKATNKLGTVIDSDPCRFTFHGPPECETPSGQKGEFNTKSTRPHALYETPREITETSAAIAVGIYPGKFETEWHVEIATSAGGPWTAAPGGSGTITGAEATAAGEPGQAGPPGFYRQVESRFELTGLEPDTTYFLRMAVENVNGSSAFQAPSSFQTVSPPNVNPPVVITDAVHGIRGEAIRGLGSIESSGPAEFHFEYVTQEQFEAGGGEGGFAKAEATPEQPGDGSVGADLTGLQPGKTYHFRLLATNGHGTTAGADQTFVAPGGPEAAGAGEPAVCANEALRGGLSAHLPDCRAYEQVTPVDKEGAVEMLGYGQGGTIKSGVLVGEDGNHVMFESSVTHWGGGQSPYFFSRNPETGWQMTAATPQPEAGLNGYESSLYSADFSTIALRAAWLTAGGTESPTVEEKVGPPGGPYTTVASVPEGSGGAGWVAASADFSKLILGVRDYNLLGPSTGTMSGEDLYEYAHGELKQVNVESGSTIGSCGATIVRGEAESTIDELGATRHAVSADGSRVFFEAVPGANCAEAKHLFMRADGLETVDLGAYTFLAASADGSKVLLEKHAVGITEVFLYDTESHAAKLLFTVHEVPPRAIKVSEDLSSIYFYSKEALTAEAPASSPVGAADLYRYDIAAEQLRFVAQTYPEDPNEEIVLEPSPDGRYYYFTSFEVAGLPGGSKKIFAAGSQQLYRFDSVEDDVECVSCASPFDPEPNLSVGNNGGVEGPNAPSPGLPKLAFSSADGDYAFFATPSALVPQDQNGEVQPEGGGEERPNGSPSTDVYEWRKQGVDGCAHVQGCVSLITPGTDGGVVSLFGTTGSGHDVFFATNTQLVSSDVDTAGDIYDARVGGGIPVAAAPVECEGDTCSTPTSLPSDATPSSFTFTGAGNLLQPLPIVKPKVTPKVLRCAKGRRPRHGRCVKAKAKRKKRAKRSSNHRKRGR
jgi:hypothetical protein